MWLTFFLFFIVPGIHHLRFGMLLGISYTPWGKLVISLFYVFFPSDRSFPDGSLSHHRTYSFSSTTRAFQIINNRFFFPPIIDKLIYFAFDLELHIMHSWFFTYHCTLVRISLLYFFFLCMTRPFALYIYTHTDHTLFM